MKTGVHVPSKSTVISKKHWKKIFFVGILSATEEKSSTRIRKSVVRILILTKMSRIHDTGVNCSSFAVCGMYRAVLSLSSGRLFISLCVTSYAAYLLIFDGPGLEPAALSW
jgi:hypothetical protein